MNVNYFMQKIIGTSDEECDRISRISRLATYNGERARGLVHTAEWAAFMAKEQLWWNTEGSSTTFYEPFPSPGDDDDGGE